MGELTEQQAFRSAAYNCILCYDFSKNNPEKDNPHTVFAQAPLKKILDSYDQEDTNWKLADEAISECNECNYQSEKISRLVEDSGINLH